MNHLKWETLHSKTVYKNKWLAVTENDVITPTGKPGMYGVVETRPFIMVIAMHRGAFVMVQQHRYTVDKLTLEFPAGGIEDNESPLEAARRELKEETGYHSGRWEALAQLDDATGIARHKAHIFLAQDVEPGELAHNNEDGIEACLLVPPDKLKTMITKGDITDTKTIALFYLAQQRAAKT